jgi:hypothetical protein
MLHPKSHLLYRPLLGQPCLLPLQRQALERPRTRCTAFFIAVPCHFQTLTFFSMDLRFRRDSLATFHPLCTTPHLTRFRSQTLLV